MTKDSKAILVTGSHRSGTTWAGQMLATAPRVGYIHEPFNSDIRISVNPRPFKRPFKHISEDAQDLHTSAFDDILHFRYPLLRNIGKVRSMMDVADIVRDQSLFLRYRREKARPLVKGPLAFFSAPWLSETFDMDVLVMIRHPAAFCSSLKIKNWQFDFNHFLKQPSLMEKYLARFEDEIRAQAENRKNIIEQATLLWNCIHHTISIYQEEHPDWIFIRHEDLSLDPLGQFRSLYNTLDLKFTRHVEAKILKNSGAHNPTEQKSGNEFMRNSRKNIKNWKKRLTAKEADLIRRETDEISASFYSENTW